MKVIKIIVIIGVAVVMLFGTLAAFMAQSGAFTTAAAADGYTWISQISGGGPTALIIAMFAIVIGVIVYAFKR